MKKYLDALIPLLLFVSCCVRASDIPSEHRAARSRPSVPTNEVSFQLFLPEAPKPVVGRNVFELFQNRSENSITNRLNLFWEFQFLGASANRARPFERAAKDARRALSEGLRLALRERFVPSLIEGGFWRDAFGGMEERYHLASPFEASEGIPGQPKKESWHRHFRGGIRPFRTNPYGYLGYGRKDGFGNALYQIDLRGHVDNWSPRLASAELVASVPIEQWALGAGVQVRSPQMARERGGSSFNTFLGLSGSLKGGIVSLAIGGPIPSVVIAGTWPW